MERYVFSEEKRAALEGLHQPFAVYQFINMRVVTLLLSDGFCDLFGYTDRATAMYDMDNNMYKDAHPDDVARIAEAAIRFATEGGKYEVVYRTRKGGPSEYVVVHAMGEHVYMEDGTRLAQIWYTNEGSYVEDAADGESDINRVLSDVLHEQSLVKASRYDYLTGLPSMTYFFELAEAGKENKLRAGGHPTMLYINFTGMKFFNTKHGFAAGDSVLRSFAGMLARAFGNENCCHINADHFAAIAEETGLEETLQDIFREFGALFDGKTPPVHVGIYPHHMEDVSVSVALDRAKLACTTLKSSYSSGYNYFNAALREKLVLRQHIIENLDTALRERWVQVYLQPIIRAVNGKICDVEALSRWVDPEKGVLSPDAFIPALEESGLIYKLDLYMVDRVLEAIHTQEAEGFIVVPHSVNLSRADFDACDIVEEIRKRVDAAGVPRDRITIEITESIIGSDFRFMKEQVERFRALGFPVWMDDFGSGYSALDVLQSIPFDLIKFDMSFMRRLDEGEGGRLILTELMRMATSLGVDTVCEGVETEDQVRFLQEIGCSKLQGFYFSKPTSFDEIRQRFRIKDLIPNENPAESAYFESIGRANLFDIGITAGEADALHGTFDAIPIAVIEVRDGKGRYIRGNRSCREFLKRFYHLDVAKGDVIMDASSARYGATFLAMIRQCCETGSRAFFDEKTPDGWVLHAFARRISVNPVTGSAAIALTILSISEPDQRTTFADIARSLAADYYNIYVIDLDTDDYTEYSSRVGGEELSVERQGADFFASARRDTMTRIYEEDREPFLKRFTKENVLRELDAQGVFTTAYRLIDTGTPMYVLMKITRMQGGNRIILGVSIIDAQMKQQEEEKKLRQEKESLGRIAALAPDYIVLYTVDPDTGHYTQYNPTDGFEDFGLANQGTDFFGDVIMDAPKAVAPEDIEENLRILTKENILREIETNGFLTHYYRLKLEGRLVPVFLRATLVQEDEGRRIVIGVGKANGSQTVPQTTAEGLAALQQENDKLKQQAAVAKKIVELKESVSSLLTNMPGMTFSKDTATGRYLACNQAFADYAHKATPEGVVGLTDFEIFDAVTAAHFVEDDKKAMDLEGPYVFFEDVADAAGSPRQFQTTKLKFIDSAGRQCLLGLCLDVTDATRIRRERDTTREAYEKARDMGTIYTHIALSLARGCTDLYYVDMDTDEFIEFHTNDELGVLNEARRGNDFFEGCERDAKLFVHPDDQASFVAAMDRSFLRKALEKERVFELIYRRIKEGSTFYVRMKVSRIESDPRHVVIAVGDIDEEMKQRRAEKRMKEERVIYARLHAITGNFICVYVVDPETGNYREFSATDDYVESFAQAKDGTDFFNTLRAAAKVFSHPDDTERVMSLLTQENVMEEIAHSGIFTLGYRLVTGGKSFHVQLKAAMVEEEEGPRLIVGLNDIDAQVRQEEEYGRRLAEAQTQANIDALTGVKNKHAYLETEARMDRQIHENRQGPFAVVMLDVNDLKKVNDTSGHQAGDQYLRDACYVICHIFDHSPVFRVGGDEFVVISQGSDYAHMDELLARLRAYNEKAARDGGVIIAYGMAKSDNDNCVAAVFERADHNMYENKNAMKAPRKEAADR